MKYLKPTLKIVLALAVLFYLLPLGLMQIPPVQRFASGRIAGFLENTVQSPVEIGRIEPGFLNHFIIRDVAIADRQGDSLFRASRLEVGFDLLPLLRKKLRINSCQIISFELNLRRDDRQSPLNIRFLLDAFAGRDTTKNSEPIDINIHKLKLRRGTLSYTVASAPDSPDRFNPDRFTVGDLTAEIAFSHTPDDKTIRLAVAKLAFASTPGLTVRNIAFDLMADSKEARINNLKITTEKSNLLFSDISVVYADDEGRALTLEKIPFAMHIDDSEVYPDELAAFVPALSDFDDRLNISGIFAGTVKHLSASDMKVSLYNYLQISADLEAWNVADKSEALFDLTVNESFITAEGIRRITENLSRKPFAMPRALQNLKNIRFYGAVGGCSDSIAANGTFATEAGTALATLKTGHAQTDFIRGKILTDSLDLGLLLGNNNFGQTVFDITLDAGRQPAGKFAGLIDGNISRFRFKGYDYENITLDGKFASDSYNGYFSLDAPDGRIEASGLFMLGDDKNEFRFLADVEKLNPNKLNLTGNMKDVSFSTVISADFAGTDADNTFGNITLNNLSVETPKGVYSLDTLRIDSQQNGADKSLTVTSSLINAEINGNYNLSQLGFDIGKTFSQYLPALFTDKKNLSEGKENTFSIVATVEDMSELSSVFSLPFTLRDRTRIAGHYNSYLNRFNIDITAPWLAVAGTTIEQSVLHLSNRNETATLNVEGQMLQKKSKTLMPFTLGLEAADNTVEAALKWGDDADRYHGRVGLRTLFARQEAKAPLATTVSIDESQVVVNDSVWTLRPAQIAVDTAGVRIDNLQADHGLQFLKIDGALSHAPEERLTVTLNEMDLEYIFSSLNIPALEFGGIATGFVSLEDAYRTRRLQTRLDVRDFSFNRSVFGHLDLTGLWDDETQGVIMRGRADKTDSSVNIDGVIYPVSEELSITFDADRADARFLRKYLDNVAKDITGSMSGQLRLFGNLNNPTVEGRVFAQDCCFGIDFLNTRYSFTDSVICLPDEIRISNVRLHDERGKSAIANGYVHHRLFSDFRFDADVTFDDLLVFNATEDKNPAFYGQAFGSGSAHLDGTENLINITVAMNNTANTSMTLNFMEEQDVADFDFIHFVQPKQKTDTAVSIGNSAPQSVSDADRGTEIRLNLMLQANRQATVNLMMDPRSGDKISGFGSGNLQIQYGTLIPLRVLGNYRIERGKYGFSLQQALHYDFDLADGSVITFNGDPYIANLDLTARHTVQANLSDLDRQLAEQQQSVKNNIPVDCILRLSGTLDHPGIAFDIDLPGSTDELNRQVRSYFRTEDLLNQQFVYLLVLDRFYTAPEYLSDNGRANNNMSYLTSTLSSQLSNMLGSISDKFQLGAKYHQSIDNEQTSTEMELLLSSQLLDDRLIINGNFGYIDRPYLQNENRSNIPLIGDFDLEYLLKKNGDIRLKFFNHYNYRYLSPRPEMTQGLGVVFRRDFNRFGDIFAKRPKKIEVEEVKN